MLNSKLQLNKDLFQQEVELKSTREGYGLGVVQAGEKDENIVVLCADLTESTKSDLFEKRFPERFIEIGVAEQNMAGISAGLALSGKIPFMASYAEFSPGRNWEQIRISICLSNQNVKIISTHGGLSPSYDGATAQCLEDIALTRVLPNMVVIEPIDFWQAKSAVREAAKHKGPVYIRLGREASPVITTEHTPFEIGKAYKLIEGDDITIISSGPIMYEVLSAAKELRAKTKVRAEVIALPTIKPIDETVVLGSVRKTNKVLTVENHQIYGGVGSAVAELLSEKLPSQVFRMGMKDSFGESGRYSDLLDKYCLSSHHITAKVLEILK